MCFVQCFHGGLTNSSTHTTNTYSHIQLLSCTQTNIHVRQKKTSRILFGLVKLSSGGYFHTKTSYNRTISTIFLPKKPRNVCFLKLKKGLQKRMRTYLFSTFNFIQISFFAQLIIYSFLYPYHIRIFLCVCLCVIFTCMRIQYFIVILPHSRFEVQQQITQIYSLSMFVYLSLPLIFVQHNVIRLKNR